MAWPRHSWLRTLSSTWPEDPSTPALGPCSKLSDTLFKFTDPLSLHLKHKLSTLGTMQRWTCGLLLWLQAWLVPVLGGHLWLCLWEDRSLSHTPYLQEHSICWEIHKLCLTAPVSIFFLWQCLHNSFWHSEYLEGLNLSHVYISESYLYLKLWNKKFKVWSWHSNPSGATCWPSNLGREPTSRPHLGKVIRRIFPLGWALCPPSPCSSTWYLPDKLPGAAKREFTMWHQRSSVTVKGSARYLFILHTWNSKHHKPTKTNPITRPIANAPKTTIFDPQDSNTTSITLK